MSDYGPKKIKVRKPKPLTKERLEFLALRYVTRYSATRGMLGRTLQRHIDKTTYADKDYDKNTAMQWKDAILNRYEEKNWINDGDLTKRYIEHAQHSGVSKQKMQQKLLGKGVDKNLIKEKMMEAVDEGSFDEMDLKSAQIFAKKKSLGIYRKHKDADPKKELTKMCRAGFSFETARKALNVEIEED